MGALLSSKPSPWCSCANDASSDPEFSKVLSTSSEALQHSRFGEKVLNDEAWTSTEAFDLQLGTVLHHSTLIPVGEDDLSDSVDDLSVLSMISPTKERKRLSKKWKEIDKAQDKTISQLVMQLQLDDAPGLDVLLSTESSLYKALLTDDLETLSQLIEREDLSLCSIRFQETGESALHVATVNSNEDMVRFILAQPDVNINARDYEGMTALQRALLLETTPASIIHALGDARQAQFMQSPRSPAALSNSVSSTPSDRRSEVNTNTVKDVSSETVLHKQQANALPVMGEACMRSRTSSFSDLSDPVVSEAQMESNERPIRKQKSLTKRFRKAAGKALSFVRPKAGIPPRPHSDRAASSVSSNSKYAQHLEPAGIATNV